MIRLSKAQIDEVFSNEAVCEKMAAGLSSYQRLQKCVWKIDVSQHEEFQRGYAKFYGLNAARKSVEWRRRYFRVMESEKATGMNLSFRAILDFFKRETGKYEPSFVSKLIATVNPNRQVIDRHVLRNFGLRLPSLSVANRAEKIDEVYNLLGSEYAKLLDPEPRQEYVLGKYVCEKFDAKFQGSGITSLKKIDLVLWQIRVA